MILDTIYTYTNYRHKETGRTVRVNNDKLQIKTDRHWQTAVSYITLDDSGKVVAEFAVPVDDFRQRFEVIEKQDA